MSNILAFILKTNFQPAPSKPIYLIFSVVSKLCHYVGSFFHLMLLSNATAENEEEKSVASVSAILFFILALQTGLTSLEPEKRFSRICKNLCLLLTGKSHLILREIFKRLLSRNVLLLTRCCSF